MSLIVLCEVMLSSLQLGLLFAALLAVVKS